MRMIREPWLPVWVGKGPYLWLGSLFFMAWKYLYITPSLTEVLMLALTVALFFPIYLASYWLRDRRALPCIVGTLLLGMLWAPYNFGASSFFIYAAVMCARISDKRKAYAMLAVVLTAAGAVSLLIPSPYSFSFLLPALIVGGPVGVGSIMDASLRQARALIVRKQEEVEYMATIAERERISRDLHDLLGHTLSLITLKAELAGKLIGRDVAACTREIKDIETSARHALSEVRAAVTGYRQTGFAHELDSARAALGAADVALTVNVQPFAFPPTAENVLALALREAVTNIVRHAGATCCEVSVTLEAGMIVFRIHDNGNKLAANAVVASGNGLAGMRERVTALGGQLVVRCERGLALELTLPMGVPA